MLYRVSETNLCYGNSLKLHSRFHDELLDSTLLYSTPKHTEMYGYAYGEVVKAA